ncbi:inactive protein RESTRICTED TEV MOVEMENT 2-like [Lycium ferocissimum]|uniref:inactive protein RESTRICTED TEV MOVEMENT 2-like n=1 Tax=Lycium ferocissimum TaxID=112874 RepID=UPI002815F471|nr:inactive protein RESTRICTED TEV MOVEMENT 2-like [Lycium ferocissimum]
MDSKGAAAAVPTQVYEDFVPTTELVQEQDSDTHLLNLTGFKKEQVRVQLTGTAILKISGQKPVVRQLRFQKDFPVSENCDKTKISAEFENGILYVKQPKLITSSDKKDQEPPTANAQQPKKPADEPQPQKKDEEQAKGQKTTPPTTKELPKQQANADKPEIEETGEETATNITAQDRNRQNYECKPENDANTGIAALAEKLKMPRKVMNMSLIALLVLGIGLYVSHMMKSAITKFTN